RVVERPEDRTRDEEERRRAHEILAETVPYPTPYDAAIARSHRPQVQDAQVLVVERARLPAEHPRPVAVDPVPHHLPDEAADLAKTRDPVELRHAHGHLVAAGLRHELSADRVVEPGLAGAGPEARIRLHALHQALEIAIRELEIDVELADVVVVLEADRLEP